MLGSMIVIVVVVVVEVVVLVVMYAPFQISHAATSKRPFKITSQKEKKNMIFRKKKSK